MLILSAKFDSASYLVARVMNEAKCMRRPKELASFELLCLIPPSIILIGTICIVYLSQLSTLWMLRFDFSGTLVLIVDCPDSTVGKYNILAIRMRKSRCPCEKERRPACQRESMRSSGLLTNLVCVATSPSSKLVSIHSAPYSKDSTRMKASLSWAK